jgi:hypothetical protein
MAAMNSAIYAIQDFSRDPGFAGATVTIDPSKWSTRRRNTITRALEDGIAACGFDTGMFIKRLIEANGGDRSNVAFVNKWNDFVETSLVREEMLTELLSYTAAWLKLTGVDKDGYGFRYYQKAFLTELDEGKVPNLIPLPYLSLSEQSKFIKKYLKQPEESEKDIRQSIIRKIENNLPLQINIEAGA